MKNPTLTERYLTIREELKNKNDLFEKKIKEVSKKKILAVQGKTRSEVSKLENQIYQVEKASRDKISVLEVALEEKEAGHYKKTQPLANALHEMRIDYEIYSMNFQENKEAVDSKRDRVKPADIIKLNKLRLMHIIAEVTENSNNVNKYTASIYVFPLNFTFRNLLSKNKFPTKLYDKTFKNAEDAILETLKVYDAQVQAVVNYHSNVCQRMDELFKSIVPAKEFDFRLTSMNLSGYNIKNKSKNAITISCYHHDNKVIKIKHTGDLRFEASCNDVLTIADVEVVKNVFEDYHPLGLTTDRIKLFYKTKVAGTKNSLTVQF